MSDILKKGFEGALLKVERAYRHIDELQATITNLSGIPSNALAVTIQPDGRQIIKFAAFGERGRFIPLIIGDAIHNMRSSFDHLWLALHRTTSDNGKPTFPFHETRENLVDTVAKSPVKKAFPDTEGLILDHIKPHRDAGGNELVWALTYFDNIDKHNLIIPTVNVNKVESAVIKVGKMTIHMTNNTHINSGGFIASDVPIETKYEGDISFDITFPQDDVFGGQPIVPTLLNMAQATTQAVKLFTNTFL